MKLAHPIYQLLWRVKLFHQEDDQLQVSALATLFWWKVLFKSTCKHFSYSVVPQFSIHATIATNTTLCWPKTAALIRQRIATNPDLTLWSLWSKRPEWDRNSVNSSKGGDGIPSDNAFHSSDWIHLSWRSR